MTELDVNQVILEVLDLLHAETVRNRVAVCNQLEGNLPLVRADRIELQQVLLNLTMNAIEAKSAGDQRSMVITSARDEGSIRVSVSDSGPGLEAEAADQVFYGRFTQPNLPEWEWALRSAVHWWIGSVDGFRAGRISLAGLCLNLPFRSYKQSNRVSDVGVLSLDALFTPQNQPQQRHPTLSGINLSSAHTPRDLIARPKSHCNSSLAPLCVNEILIAEWRCTFRAHHPGSFPGGFRKTAPGARHSC